MPDFGDEAGDVFLQTYQRFLQWAGGKAAHVSWTAGRALAAWAARKIREALASSSAADELAGAMGAAGGLDEIGQWADLDGIEGGRALMRADGKAVVEIDLSDNLVDGEPIDAGAAEGAIREHLDADGFAGAYDLELSDDGRLTVLLERERLEDMAASLSAFSERCAERAGEISRIPGVRPGRPASREAGETAQAKTRRLGEVKVAVAGAPEEQAGYALAEDGRGGVRPRAVAEGADEGLTSAYRADLREEAARGLEAELSARGAAGCSVRAGADGTVELSCPAKAKDRLAQALSSLHPTARGPRA